jgi:hypothetical protein
MGELVVSRSLLIGAPAAEILDQVADLHKWRDWSPWEGLDPHLKRDYAGPQSGVGATYTWSGNRKAGAGTMRVASVTDDGVAINVEFTKPFPSKSLSNFTVEAREDATKVTWTMTTTQNLIMRLSGIFIKFDRMLGRDIEKGLAGLAAVTQR